MVGRSGALSAEAVQGAERRARFDRVCEAPGWYLGNYGTMVLIPQYHERGGGRRRPRRRQQEGAARLSRMKELGIGLRLGARFRQPLSAALVHGEQTPRLVDVSARCRSLAQLCRRGSDARIAGEATRAS